MRFGLSFVQLPGSRLVAGVIGVCILNASGCGASGTAGRVDQLGTTQSGGSGGSTNVVQTGGAPASSPVVTGGSMSNPQTGGASAIGGASSKTGGASATGGSKPTGGAPATGGTKQTGGALAVGGTKASGGGAATGGAAATGGTKAASSTQASGGTSTSSSTNAPITGGASGFATRYWDCCKPSCAWTTNVPACQKDGTTKISDKNAKSGCDSGGSAFECYDFSPWYDSSTNMSYGFAAYNASGCGVCYELQFSGSGQYGANAGAAAIKGKQMIVQVINIGNITSGQFDLLIPGGGVGAETAGCSAQWGSSVDLGSTNGGLLSECNNDPTCMANKCQSVFGGMSGLLAGCNWFTGWFASADNPQLIYKQVSCPSQITSKSGISG